MSFLHTIAVSVSELLADYDAEVVYSPEFELRDLASKKCIIVPVNAESKPICRNSKIIETSYHLEIGFLIRGKNLDLSQLLSRVERIVKKCLHFRSGNAMCVRADPSPLYDQEQLRQRNQFTSVIALTFKEVSYGG